MLTDPLGWGEDVNSQKLLRPTKNIPYNAVTRNLVKAGNLNLPSSA